MAHLLRLPPQPAPKLVTARHRPQSLGEHALAFMAKHHLEHFLNNEVELADETSVQGILLTVQNSRWLTITQMKGFAQKIAAISGTEIPLVVARQMVAVTFGYQNYIVASQHNTCINGHWFVKRGTWEGMELEKFYQLEVRPNPEVVGPINAFLTARGLKAVSFPADVHVSVRTLSDIIGRVLLNGEIRKEDVGNACRRLQKWSLHRIGYAYGYEVFARLFGYAHYRELTAASIGEGRDKIIRPKFSSEVLKELETLLASLL